VTYRGPSPVPPAQSTSDFCAGWGGFRTCHIAGHPRQLMSRNIPDT
jgi:hypothetical protein